MNYLTNLGNISDLLNNLDNVAKETLEEPKESATVLRLQKKKSQLSSSSENQLSSDDDYVNVNKNESSHIINSIEVGTEFSTGIFDINEPSFDSLNEAYNDPTPSDSIHAASSKSFKNADFNISSSINNGKPEVPPTTNASGSRSNKPPPASKIQSTPLSSSNHSQGITGTVTASTTLNLDAATKQLLKSKNKEIETLNAEILELEETCSSLKLEVQDAWNSYKSMQDKSMMKENDLLDEIKLLQKAKSTDQQNIQIQLNTMNDEISNLLTKIKVMETEKFEYIERIKLFENEKKLSDERQKILLSEIDELKVNTAQGVHGLREENKRLTNINDELHLEKLNLIRKHEANLYEYETQHNQYIQAIRDKEKEITSLKSQLTMSGGLKDYQQLTRDYDSLQNEYENINKTYIYMRDTQLPDYESKIRQLESELKMCHIRAEDENHRVTELLQLSDKKIIELQNDLAILTKQQQLSSVNTNNNNDSNLSSSMTLSLTSNSSNINEKDKTTLLMEQIQSLSKQLLKKQEITTELQTEKSLLKSKIMDLTARCTQAELEISRLKDIEDGEEDGGDEESNNNYNNNSVSSIQGNGLIHRTSSTPNSTAGGTGLLASTPIRENNSAYQHSQSKSRYRPSSRTSTTIQLTTELQQLGINQPNPTVVKAMNRLDSFTLLIGRFLRTHSIIRIFFVLYLLILHIWVFAILAMHVHTIDVDNTPPVPIVNNIVKRTIS